MRRCAAIALSLVMAAAAAAQTMPPPTEAPAPPDTLTARFRWSGDGPAPAGLHVVPAQTELGGIVTIVVDLPPEAVALPADSLRVDVDWLEPAPDVQVTVSGDLPAPPGPRLLAPFRIYRLGPWRAAWGDDPAGRVLAVAGRLESGETFVPVRDPRRLGGLPAWLPIAVGSLLVALITWLVWRRLRRRSGIDEAVDLPLAPPAWLQAATDLWALEESRGQDRSYLDALAAVLRRYLHGRYHLPAEEMTAGEIAAAARRAGWPAVRLGAFAAILARCDEARYAPAGVTAAQCRDGMQRLLDLIDAERVEPIWTPVAPTRTAAAVTAWNRLRERYPLARERTVPC